MVLLFPDSCLILLVSMRQWIWIRRPSHISAHFIGSTVLVLVYKHGRGIKFTDPSMSNSSTLGGDTNPFQLFGDGSSIGSVYCVAE